MRFVFVVNAFRDLSETQTTTLLALQTASLGVEVDVANVASLGLRDDGHVIATCRRLRPGPVDGTVTLFSQLEPGAVEVDLTEADVVWIRTNPARDERAWAHHTMLKLLRIARDSGVAVINDPEGLERASSKLYLHRVPPAFRPRTLVTGSPHQIREFIADCPGGRAVLKPLTGTRGRDVFLIEGAEERNLNAIIDVLVRDGYAICQDFVPEAVEGDTRLVLLDGQLMTVDGQPLAVRRIPSGRDFRSNVHVGGQAAPAEVSDAMLEVVEAVGPILMEDGLVLVGVDFIGGKLVEINAFSTGGFFDAQQFYDRDFIAACVDHVVESQRSGRLAR